MCKNIVILNWQRPLWEGDWEVVKRSGRDESIRVVIHLCMEAMPGISLYSCPYLKLAKTLCLSYYLSCFLFKTSENKKVEQVLPRGGAGRAWPKQCIHVSKCKNNKI
jgi:hypothetical protein